MEAPYVHVFPPLLAAQSVLSPSSLVVVDALLTAIRYIRRWEYKQVCTTHRSQSTEVVQETAAAVLVVLR